MHRNGTRTAPGTTPPDVGHRSRLRGLLLVVGIGVTSGVAVSSAAEGDVKKTRDQLVEEDVSTWGEEDGWIYNDLSAALDEGKRTGKPIMAVLRCIP